LTFLPTEQPVL